MHGSSFRAEALEWSDRRPVIPAGSNAVNTPRWLKSAPQAGVDVGDRCRHRTSSSHNWLTGGPLIVRIRSQSPIRRILAHRIVVPGAVLQHHRHAIAHRPVVIGVGRTSFANRQASPWRASPIGRGRNGRI